MLEKFKSRKFLVTLLNVIVGILTLFGVDEGLTSDIMGIGMIVIPSVVYILTEGKIDWERIKNSINDLIEVIDDKDNTETK